MNTPHACAGNPQIEPMNVWPLPATAWVEASVMDGEQSIAVIFDPRPFLAMASESELALLARAGWSGRSIMRAVQCLAHAGDAELRRWFRQFGDWLDAEHDITIDGSIDPQLALQWLGTHRPQVVPGVLAASRSWLH